MSGRGTDVVAGLLRTNGGVVTRADIDRAGVHHRVLGRLVRAGALERIGRGVYQQVGRELSWNERTQRAVVLLGGQAVASHRGAARLCGVAGFDDAPVEVSVPSKRRHLLADVVVHESRDLDQVPTVLAGGVPCTPLLRVALDLGAVLGETAYTTALRTLRRDHGITWTQLAGVLRLHSRRGRDGCGPLRSQLERYFGIDGIPDTALEQVLLDGLLDAGYPTPTCQHRVWWGPGRWFCLDFAYVEAKVAVEVDGPHHLDPRVAVHDRWRQRVLEDLGWIVLRCTEDELVHTMPRVLLDIADALRRRGAWTGRVTSRPGDRFRIDVERR